MFSVSVLYEYILLKLIEVMKQFLAFSCLFVLVEQLGSCWTDFHEIEYLGFLLKLVTDSDFGLNLTITDTLHEDLHTFKCLAIIGFYNIWIVLCEIWVVTEERVVCWLLDIIDGKCWDIDIWEMSLLYLSTYNILIMICCKILSKLQEILIYLCFMDSICEF